MADAARKISVVVDADSAPLQTAVAKAADSLKALGNELLKQQQAAVKGSQQTIASNQDVAASYERTAGAVQGSTLKVVQSIQTQVAEQHRAAVAASESAGTQGRAAGAVGDAQAGAAAKANVAADEQVAASKRVSDAAVRSSATQAKAFGASGSTLVGWGKKVALTAAGVAGASVYMATKFEEATLKLHTQAGATTGQMAQLRKGMLDMAGAVGQTPMELETGMYHVVSSMNALLPKATAVKEELRVLRVAAEGAAVGGTNMEETSYALASAMNALHLRAGDAEKAMGSLNAIVGAGDMTMNDLLDSLKSGVLPTAQAFGTSLQSVGGALAVFGDEGIRGAEAGTKLRMMFALLGGPTQKSVEILKSIGVSAGDMKTKFAGMQKALEEAGVSTTKMSEDLKQPDGLFVALSDLKDHLEKSGLSATASAAVISRAFGGGRTGAGIMLLVQNLDRLHAKYDQVGKGSESFGKDFAATQKTLAFQAKQLGAEAESVAIKLGEKLIPAARDGIKEFKAIAHWFHEGSTEAKVLEGVIAGGLSVAVAAFTVNKLGKMVEGLREAGRLLKLPGISGGGSGGGISGVRGPAGAGSAVNPIAVTMEGRGPGGPGAPVVPPKSGPEDVPGKFVPPTPLAAAAGALAIGSVALTFKEFMSPPTRPITEETFKHYWEKGLPIKHQYGSETRTTTYAPGQGPEFHPGPPGGYGRTELRGIGPAQTHAMVQNTLAQVQANRLLITSNATIKQSEEQLASMREQGETHTSQYRETLKTLAAAEQEHSRGVRALSAAEQQHSTAMRTHVERDILRLDTALHEHPDAGTRSAVAANYSKLVAIIGQQMDAGQLTVAEGTIQINKTLEAEAKALGVNLPSALSAVGKGVGKVGGAVSKGLEGVGLAKGGLIQLGKPGEAGRDSIPLNAGGMPIVAAPGEQVAVFTRHQQEVANKALAPMGGLPGLFKNVSTPHYMATGGFVPAPGTNYSVGQEPQIAADLRRLGQYLHVMLIGLSGYRSPAHSIAVGGFADDPHTRGEASDTQGTQNVPESVLEKFGLTRPFPGAKEADHMQLLHGGAGFSGIANAIGAVGGAAAQAAVKAITAPHVHGQGVIAKIAQGALNKVAGAANAKLGQTSFSGVPGHGGSHSANEALGRRMMLAAGWPASEWPALQALWTQESGWDANSVNPSSGAYGIPQALGHGHPFALGDARGQIAWGLNYIRGRYGSPSAAEAHERAFNWYSHGGMVPAAGGLLAAAASTKKKREKPTGHGHKAPTGLAGLIHKLGGVPDTENVKALQPFPPLLERLSNERSLLSRIQGLPQSTGVLTPQDAAIMQSAGDRNAAAGMPMGTVAEALINEELAANEGLLKADQTVQRSWEELVAKYRDRQKRIRTHQEREYFRLTNIKRHYERLTTGQLKTRVAQASNRDHDRELVNDARASRDALAQNLEGEKQLPSKSQDKKLIAKWEADKRRLDHYITGLSKAPSQKGAALVNLRKNELSNEMHPLEENLFTLGGSRTAIGHSGQYGTVGDYIKRLNEGVTRLGGEIATEQQATIPGLKVELEQQKEETQEAGLKPAEPSTEGNSELDSLNKTLIQQLSETITLQGAQLATFKNFIPQIPKYEKGGPVVQDGLIYAHKGEHVVPVGGTLAVNSSAPSVQTNVHLHGELAPLIKIIDDRVQHPDNVRQVSQQVARRTILLRR